MEKQISKCSFDSGSFVTDVLLLYRSLVVSTFIEVRQSVSTDFFSFLSGGKIVWDDIWVLYS